MKYVPLQTNPIYLPTSSRVNLSKPSKQNKPIIQAHQARENAAEPPPRSCIVTSHLLDLSDRRTACSYDGNASEELPVRS